MNQSSINNIDSYASSQVISNCNSGSIKSLGVNESKENLKSDNLGELHALLPDGTVYKSKMNILNSLGVEFLSKFISKKTGLSMEDHYLVDNSNIDGEKTLSTGDSVRVSFSFNCSSTTIKK